MKFKRIACYLRCSTADQSTELQRREIGEYLQARGWSDSVTWFDDAGFTGTNTNRPKLKELMAAARARKVDIVIVWKLDRWARSLKDLVLGLDELTQLGVEFISLKDQVDLTTSVGRLMANMLGSFAAFEADLIKERVRAGLANAKAKGKKLGRPCTIDTSRVHQLRKQGMSLSQIAESLGTTKSGVSKTLRRSARQVA